MDFTIFFAPPQAPAKKRRATKAKPPPLPADSKGALHLSQVDGPSQASPSHRTPCPLPHPRPARAFPRRVSPAVATPCHRSAAGHPHDLRLGRPIARHQTAL